MLLEVLICNKRLGRLFYERKQLGAYKNPKYPDMPLKYVLDDIILSGDAKTVDRLLSEEPPTCSALAGEMAEP
ncbi:hypothetical protein RHGRI_003918 [Rhododendron griersonianum]|uniref:Uncharacterized protein n=1 Tax=Rhododendron griersonianum TaxID=479676 RepID=A0AAV6L9D2_9ERIC|nr:hypothetical protein RHGRI_003918 [Rhododendron griersonianum]